MKTWTDPTTRIQADLSKGIGEVNFGYEYPGDYDFRPSHPCSDFIVKRVKDMALAAKTKADTRRSSWPEIDRTLTAYVPAEDVDRLARGGFTSERGRVVIPWSFANLEIFLTYFSGAFLGSPTIHRYTSNASERGKIRAALLERVVSKHDAWFRAPLYLSTMYRDSFAYGVGFVSPVWSRHKARKPMTADIDAVVAELLKKQGFDSVEAGDMVRYLEEVTLMEGNKLQNIDPYQVLMDPNKSINDIQSAEFFGYVQRTHAMELLQREADPEEGIFNAKYCRMLAETGQGSSVYWNDSHGRNDRAGNTAPGNLQSGRTHGDQTTGVDVIWMWANIIPDEWGLGKETWPVKWGFGVAGDSVLVYAQPLDLDHGMYPLAACAPCTTGYDTFPVSLLATVYGQQEASDWFIKSHVENVAKTMNGMLVVNGSVIEMSDVLNPGAGKIIRFKPGHYSEGGIDQYIKQLDVQDVTANHIANAGIFMDFMSKILGTTDITAGDLSNMPDRPTARGIEAAKTGALSRLQRMALIVGEQAMSPLALIEAYHAIQFQDQDVAVSILGRHEAELRKEFGIPPGRDDLLVSPWDLEASFEVESATSARNSGEDLTAMTEVVKTAMAQEGAAVQMLGGLDLQGLFLQWARHSGFKDVHDFIQATDGGIEGRSMPDEKIMQEEQAGNLVPADAVMSAQY